MIQRYSRPVMREIWSEQRKLEVWLQIELLASEALCAEGLVPRKDLKQIKTRAAFSVERCKELERTLNHDVIAFTTNVAENIGAPASRWLHYGLTSSDVGDTAFAVQMVQSAERAHRRRQAAAQGGRRPGEGSTSSRR
jgi:adenylosuccinate lyase